MIEVREKHRMGLIGTVHRGAPPDNCRMGCPEFLSEEICGTCYRRPVKGIEVSYGNEPTLQSAIDKGLVTHEEILIFMKIITGG